MKIPFQSWSALVDGDNFAHLSKEMKSSIPFFIGWVGARSGRGKENVLFWEDRGKHVIHVFITEFLFHPESPTTRVRWYLQMSSYIGFP